jgi:hypothetical protein
MKDHFAAQLNLLEQLVNYGTNLVPRCFESSPKLRSDVIVLLVFARHAVTMLDGFHILLAKCATTPAISILRSLLESSITLEWILQSETERRTTAYYVWELRRKRWWARTVRPGTKEYAAHEKHMEYSGIPAGFPGTPEPDLDQQIRQIDGVLGKPQFATINAAFESKARRGRDSDWYVPVGASSVRDMAIQVQREHEYKVLYAEFSKITHGNPLDTTIDLSDGRIWSEPIRNIIGIDQWFRHGYNIAIEIFATLLERYRPGEVENFGRKYLSEWRETLLNIPHTSYEGTQIHISGRRTKANNGRHANS